jgi:hypothetical protein
VPEDLTKDVRPEIGSGTRVVVTAGDVVVDWNLARTRKVPDGSATWNASDRTEIYGHLGGAAMLGRLLQGVAETLGPGGMEADVCCPPAHQEPRGFDDPRFNHSYAVWSLVPKKKGDREPSVWRVEEFLGLDLATAAGPAADPGPETADLVVLDDANLGFREQPRRWPKAIRRASPTGPAPWVILKTARPVAAGQLWRHLLKHYAERLIVVMTLNDLRLSEVKISRELSWERTGGDLAREIVNNPAVNGLSRCAHVVVSVGTGGAVVLSRRRELASSPASLDRPLCRVVFDPEAIENSWVEQYPGSMVGYASCLTAGIARSVLLTPDDPDVEDGTRRGLATSRALHLRGYGNPVAGSDRAGLAFPASEMALALSKAAPEFGVAVIEQPVRDDWSILESRYPEGLEAVAERVAIEGPEAIVKGVPFGRFGNLLTLDRGETEGFRSIRSLMREYVSEPAPRPLNIAVFGPPGAGKSFGVKEVVKSILDKDKIEDVTFNLSQLRDPAELADALHQVRDIGLRGKLPFVLWDEFDSDLAGHAFGWLRHFLAPMQDGSFQEGQVVHPIGKAIFVFAGGTSSNLDDFAANRSEAFKLAKGPDFVSRLKGHVDVVGPDPRGGDSQADPHFRIRRAILLRSMLLRSRPYLFSGSGKATRLAMDPGVLRAFLGVPRYRHGARSLETIVAMSTLHGKTRYERSALPAADQLDAHVDAREFMSLVERYVPDGEVLEQLAEGVHIEYCAEMLGQGHAWAGSEAYLSDRPSLRRFVAVMPTLGPLPALVDWSWLSEHLRDQNRDAARDLPGKLATLGHVLRKEAPGGAPVAKLARRDPRVEMLARREHERWVRLKERRGWHYGDPRDDARKLHPCLVPWSNLPEAERAKDRQQVMSLPRIVAAAGMTLARLDDSGELRVGVTGHRALADPEVVAAGVAAALTRICEARPGRVLAVVSALAEGADRLVAEAGLKLGARLVAVLPLPKYDYLEDFATTESKDEFLRLLGEADEVVEAKANAAAETAMGLKDGGRNAAYAAANDAVLDRSDVLVAVWDGRASQSEGGTGDVVRAARARGIPIAWVQAGNRKPGTMELRSLGADQGKVTFEGL